MLMNMPSIRPYFSKNLVYGIIYPIHCCDFFKIGQE